MFIVVKDSKIEQILITTINVVQAYFTKYSKEKGLIYQAISSLLFLSKAFKMLSVECIFQLAISLTF